MNVFRRLTSSLRAFVLPNKTRPPKILLMLSDLRNLPNSTLDFGPLKLTEWYALLAQQINESKQTPCRMINSPADIFGTPAEFWSSPNMEERQRWSITAQLLSRFPDYVVSQRRLEIKQIKDYAILFFILAGAHYRLINGHQPPPELIAKTNATLAEYKDIIPIGIKR